MDFNSLQLDQFSITMGNKHCIGLEYCHSSVGDEESGWLFQVLEFCDNKARSNVVFVCKRYHKLLTSNASFRWRIERLHIEDGVYCAVAMPNKAEPTYSLLTEPSPDFEKITEPAPFKTLFIRLLKQRMLWRSSNSVDDMTKNSSSIGEEDNEADNNTIINLKESNANDKFNIHVSVRFKPTITNNNQNSNILQRAVTLPLHQRLALIKHQNKLKSNSEALNILKEEGEWFKDKWSAFEKENMVNGNITHKEDVKKDQNHLELLSGINSIDCINHNVVIVDPTKGLRNFQFDRVLPEDCEQGTVYENSAKPLVQDFINGTNACCLVYGVTGSGKTFTMFGPSDDIMHCNTRDIQSSVTKKGIVPMFCQEIFDVLAYRRRNLNLNIKDQVSLSYVEIFGSEISDLLRQGSLCCPNKAASQRFVLNGASEYSVRNVEEVSEALIQGEKVKRKAATALNDRSSRAHSVVIISLTQVCKQTGVSRSSKLFLADLGGCEQTKKSDIVSGASKHFDKLKMEIFDQEVTGTGDQPGPYSTGFVKSDRMREAVNINLGLMALKSCVDALISKAKHIPYSDSKLTMILSSALGGNSKTSVIVCASQEKHLLKETIAALKFGQSCRHISNSLQSETDFLKQLIDNIDIQIEECQAEIKQKERWEIKEEKRKDVLATDGTLESKGFGGMETRKTTILVGAEEQHLRLSDLLRQRAEITGVSLDYEKEGSKYGGDIGFGNAHIYGMGEKYTSSYDQSQYRFGNVINDNVPVSIRSIVGNAPCTWKAGKEMSLNELEKKKMEKMKKKNQLVYSGLSA